MRPQFELYARCLLVCLGLVLTLKATVEWLQPTPDFTELWNGHWEGFGAKEGSKGMLEPFGIFQQAQSRAFLIQLLCLGVGPMVIGLNLFHFAGRIAAFCYPELGSGASAERPATAPSLPAKPAVVPPVSAPALEESDRRYAPPGDRG